MCLFQVFSNVSMSQIHTHTHTHTHTPHTHTHTHTHILFHILSPYRILNIVLCAKQQDLVIYPLSLYNSLYLLIPNSQPFLHNPLSPLATTNLFSMSVSVLQKVPLCHIQISHIGDIIWSSVFPFLTQFTQYENLYLYLRCCKWHHFILFMAEQYSKEEHILNAIS